MWGENIIPKFVSDYDEKIEKTNDQKSKEFIKYFDELVKLYSNNKLPNKILLSGQKGLGKATLAYHFVNYVLSKDEELKYDLIENKINSENKSFKLLQNNSHPNFYLID